MCQTVNPCLIDLNQNLIQLTFTLNYLLKSNNINQVNQNLSFLFIIVFFVFLKNFIYFYFLAALGLHCCAWALSSCGKQGLLFFAVCGLLVVVASLVAEYGLQALGLQQLWLVGSRVQAQQLWRPGLVALRHVGSSQTRD